jgi:hypothetical protein
MSATGRSRNSPGLDTSEQLALNLPTVIIISNAALHNCCFSFSAAHFATISHSKSHDQNAERPPSDDLNVSRPQLRAARCVTQLDLVSSSLPSKAF